MPTAKAKGVSASHRYRPASQYDDATLAQKREYWRTKKREQRARLSERRGKPTEDSQVEILLHLDTPPAVQSALSDPLAAPTLQSNAKTHKTANVSSASQSGITVADNSFEVAESQKVKWFQTMKLNKVLPQFPASCSMSAKAAGGNPATVKRLSPRGAVNRAVTSPTPSGTQPNTSSSFPPVRVTLVTNGSSTKTTPQPYVSMQDVSVPKMQHKVDVALRNQPKLLPTSVSTGMILVSSPCGPMKTEGKAANAAPQSGIKSALVTRQRENSQFSQESEEERAAKRREHWRIKKREQRAKLAAQIAKAAGSEMTVRRQTAQNTRLVGDLQHHPPHSFFRGPGHKQCPVKVKTLFTSAKRENDKLQSDTARLAAVNLQINQIKVQIPHRSRTTRTAITSDISVKKPGVSPRKLPSYVPLSNVTRGIARCKTPRQRFIEAQKNLINQRSTRCKSPLLASVLSTRNISRIDPSDTPEQAIAKRREHWRIKKREQRAKLSTEVKTRLKEKDSLMRRVKRYQKILEEMRKARLLTQSAGSTLTHASETIGGFIKEDGTVTVNVPTGQHTAQQKSKADLHVGSNNTPITQPQHQPNTKWRGTSPIRINQPPPPLRPAQVKVSFPLAGQSVNKPPTLLLIRPRTQHESATDSHSHSLAVQSVGQLTLTHLQGPQNAPSGGSTAGSHPGGCVMKMVVSSTTPSLSALSLDPELTEEEKMAKKREYWRIKKREQRAARAARLRQGILQARATAALRMKTQKHIALTTVPVGRSLTNHTENAQPLPNNSVSVTPHADEMKKESELETAVDLHSQPDQAICRDTKPPTFPPSPPTSQPESDPALTADSQATTLLAVASMKKLLEESLSTVAECKAVQAEIKTETTEDVPEKELKLNLPQLFFEKDEVAPIAADLTLQIKSWQPHTGALVQAGSSSLHLKDSSKICDTHSPLPTYSEVALHSTCGRSAQTTSNFAVIPSREASDDPSSPHIKKEDQQNCCSPEPPKLHHPPIDQLHPQQKHCEQQCQAQEECRNSNSVQSSLSSLQRKREYWKLMKRQQRARLKARQKETQGECRSRLSPRNIQAPGLISTVKGVNSPSKPAPPPKLSVASPTTHNAEQPRASLQVKLPIASASCSPRGQQNIMNIGPSQTGSDYLGAPESQKEASLGSQQWMSGSTDVDSGPSLSTLKPPDNPLSSINLQPIEPPGQSPNSALSPITVSCVQLQSHTHMIQPPNKLAPISTMGLPKPVPGESEEDFQRRKREYWRIKKKEQRARKAIQDKGIAQRRASKNWRRILPAPAPDPQTQDTGQWANPSEESEHLIRFSVEEEPGSFPYSNYTAPIEDESELLFADYGNNNGEEVPVSDTMWRNHYLMDYDPLNQLLVCMVCGELQYSHSLEEVKAHIDEAHPDTLMLEPGERQQILDTWNEQVSQRERFFTNQLQQHSCSLTEAHRNESAENGAAGVN